MVVSGNPVAVIFIGILMFLLRFACHLYNMNIVVFKKLVFQTAAY